MGGGIVFYHGFLLPQDENNLERLSTNCFIAASFPGSPCVRGDENVTTLAGGSLGMRLICSTAGMSVIIMYSDAYSLRFR